MLLKITYIVYGFALSFDNNIFISYKKKEKNMYI